jgi:hypothetical protein
MLHVTSWTKQRQHANVQGVKRKSYCRTKPASIYARKDDGKPSNAKRLTGALSTTGDAEH